MGLKDIFANSPFAKHHKAIKDAPRETIFNRSLILSTLLYAMSAMPLTWDQASSGVLPSLPGFQKHFGLDSGTNALEIRNFVSIVYVGAGVGAALSFFLNDSLGRLWSYRIYICIWILGQIIATFSPNLASLYVARIISGLGMGALTVIGPMSIVEIAPAEIRGLLTAWFNIAMNMSATCGAFCVLGVFQHLPAVNLQFQVVWFSPCIYLAVCFVASFFVCESPRWLFLVDRSEDAIKTLVKLRGLSPEHPRVQREIAEIQGAIHEERSNNTAGIVGILKETFLVSSNLRRVQQSLMSYGLAQLSGANSVTSYFVPILSLMGLGGSTSRGIFLSGMYTLSKFGFAIIASFFFIDALGRRKSLFVGVTLQMISDIYIGVFIKYKQDDAASYAASTGAIAFIFIHGFGYVVGLYILPYVFGGELWPNRIRSFGCALSQCFHWLFIFAMAYGTPSLLAHTNNWGAFIFFGGWCFISIIYVYVMVPESAGLTVEELDAIFEGSWLNAARRTRKPNLLVGIERPDELNESSEKSHDLEK